LLQRERKQLTMLDLGRIALDVASGMQYLAQKGIIHRYTSLYCPQITNTMVEIWLQETCWYRVRGHPIISRWLTLGKSKLLMDSITIRKSE
jgi:hypothetical protein